jgi:hypothetical protein
VSYDVWLQIDTGGPRMAEVGQSINYTSNVRPMWDKALEGAAIPGVAEMHGRLASDCIDPLEGAIRRMRLDPWDFEAMNPPNGWGDAAGAREFLEVLLAMCEAHPRATVVVSR